MREFLFRGKRCNKEWIYGSLLKVTYDGNTYNLIFADNFLFVFGEATAMEHAAVNPSTVGQFTGLFDKNGKKIFEGDIIKNEYEDGRYQFLKIIYNDAVHRWETENKYRCRGHLCHVIGSMEVIGNIHDNPELLEG